MKLQFERFAWVAGLIMALCVVALAGQKDTKAKTDPPASQAKTTQPATHFTQGTITSIEANQMVITKKVRGKAEQVTFAMNSQTQRSGNLAAGTRVSVQYSEGGSQKIAAAVRELPSKAAGKTAFKSRPKS